MAQQDCCRKHGCIADAVDRQNAQRIGYSGLPAVKERDEKRRAQTNEFPTDEKHLNVAGERDEQHAGHKHRKQNEVAIVAGLPVQISI